jgi:hypothetical protein
MSAQWSSSDWHKRRTHKEPVENTCPRFFRPPFPLLAEQSRAAAAAEKEQRPTKRNLGQSAFAFADDRRIQ